MLRPVTIVKCSDSYVLYYCIDGKEMAETKRTYEEAYLRRTVLMHK